MITAMKKGKGDIKISYKLSPNEVEQLTKEETIRRRKLRLVQVREQAKANAAKIRTDVKKEKAKQLNKLTCQIKNNLEKERQEKLRHLEQQYENSLKSIGTAHRAASNVKQSQVDRIWREEQQKQVANNRYQAAIKRAKREQALKDYEENKQIIARKAALEKEVLRAAEIASLPPPPPDPVEEVLKTKPKAIPMTDMNAFSTTHYHMPDYAVVKAGPYEQVDAIEAGVEEDERINQQLKERQHLDQDRIIRARIRGNEALKREHLRHEYSNMLQDLSLLQRADRRRRQEEVADLPRQVFLPPDRRLEEKENKQRDMEKAFEDMYLADKHPAVLMSLDAQSPPDTPSSAGTDGPSPPGVLSQGGTLTEETALRDVTNITGAEHQTKPNETALMKLFNRIKQQKEDHATRSALETSLIGDVPKPVVKDLSRQPSPSGTNGLSPLSEYSALETCSLPSTANHGPSPLATNQLPRQVAANQLPRQVRIEVKSPKTCKSPPANNQSPGRARQVTSPKKQESDDDKKAMQEKIIQLEAKQKELDMLINRFKQFTGITGDDLVQPGQVQGQGNQFSQSAPAGHLSQARVQYANQSVSMPPGQLRVQPDPSMQPIQYVGQVQGYPGQGQELFSSGPPLTTSRPHPSGIYHARPVQITTKEGEGRLESGYYSGLPASFRGYQGLSRSDPAYNQGIRRADGSGYAAPGDIAGHSLGLAQQADHVKRVREYQERILQSSQQNLPNLSMSHSDRSRHSFPSSSSSDLAKKVKDYQQQILEGNADRRKFLAETKANIERQRQELYKKYPLTMGGEAPSTLESSSAPEESLADRILKEIKDPLRPRSLDLLDEKSPKQPDFVGRGQEKLSTSQISSSSSKDRLERIRKSLLFEDPDESLTRTPGRDISLLAPSDIDEGDLTLTSSSERGSPNLSKTARSDGSFGGMSLIYRARETGNVFEKRQLELQQQLEEVQRQKEEILQRYELGQQKIQDSSFPRLKLDTTSSSGLSNTIKSNFTEQDDTSYASLPNTGNLRPAPRTDTAKPNQKPGLETNNFSLSLLSDFPKTLEQFSLVESAHSGQDSASLTGRTDEKSSVEAGHLFSTELEEESLSQASSRSQTFPSMDKPLEPTQSGFLSLEEESLSPESRVDSDQSDKITWANLLTGVPSVSSSEEENGFKTVDSKPADYVAHDLSTIFEVDTPTTTPAGQSSGQFVTLTSTQA